MGSSLPLVSGGRAATLLELQLSVTVLSCGSSYNFQLQFSATTSAIAAASVPTQSQRHPQAIKSIQLQVFSFSFRCYKIYTATGIQLPATASRPFSATPLELQLSVIVLSHRSSATIRSYNSQLPPKL